MAKFSIVGVVVAATTVLLSGCAKEPPKCSDPVTIGLAKDILLEGLPKEIRDSPALDLKSRINLELPRATGLDEKIHLYSCEANLKLGAANATVNYGSQLDDRGAHLVTVSKSREIEFLLMALAASETEKVRAADQSSPTTPYPQTTSTSTSEDAAMEDKIVAQIDTLVNKLDRNPANANDWILLGRSYVATRRYGEAIPAFRQVLNLQPRNAQAMADLADAIAMTQNRSFQGEPADLIDSALQIDPDNLKALALAGTRAYEDKSLQVAIMHWEHAVKVGPPGNDLVKQLNDNLVEVRKQLAQSEPPAWAQKKQ